MPSEYSLFYPWEKEIDPETELEVEPIYESSSQTTFHFIKLNPEFHKIIPKFILALDVDFTLLHALKCNEPGITEPELMYEKQFREILGYAKKMEGLVMISTSRYYWAQIYARDSLNISLMIEKLEGSGDPLFDGIIYTNTAQKVYGLRYLQGMFSLAEDRICLVDDNPYYLEAVEKEFETINILKPEPFKKMMAFIQPGNIFVGEPPTPIVQEYTTHLLFKLPEKMLKPRKPHDNDCKSLAPPSLPKP
jgi:hypothetical protein